MIQPSELQILILALALMPLMAWAYRGISLRGKGWLAAAVAASIGSYFATTLEGLIASRLMHATEHLLYAVAGLCFTGLAVALWEAEPPADIGDLE